MSAITTRIRRLEARLALEENRESQRTADILRERLRRHMEAEGVPPSPPPLGPVRYLSIAETLRRGHERAYECNRAGPLAQAETPTDNGY